MGVPSQCGSVVLVLLSRPSARGCMNVAWLCPPSSAPHSSWRPRGGVGPSLGPGVRLTPSLCQAASGPRQVVVLLGG